MILAQTDKAWFDFLSARPGIDEVNFWSRRCWDEPAGEPFIFKLKAPYNRICGFGAFEFSQPMPLQLAWEFYGEKNGAADFATFRGNISRVCQENLKSTDTIACTLIAAPVFFREGIAVAVPDSFKANTVRGKRYDIASTEGAELWNRLRALASVQQPTVSYGAFGGRGAPVLRTPRIGQGTFRKYVLDAYGNQCAVTGEHTIPVLQASHIVPFAETGEHEIANGLSLRSDVHRLFDLGYVTVTPDYEFRVSKALRDDFSNGKIYYEHQGQTILLPERTELRPNRDYLDHHARTIFLG